MTIALAFADRLSKLRWLRQAGALLCIGIVAVIGVIGNGKEAAALVVIHRDKIEMPCVSIIAALVRDPTDQIDFPPVVSGLNIRSNFVGRQHIPTTEITPPPCASYNATSRYTMSPMTATRESILVALFRFVWVSSGQPIVIPNHVKVAAQNFGWGLSIIENFDAATDRHAGAEHPTSGGMFYRGEPEPKMWAMRCGELFVSSPPERQCEGGYGDSRERGEGGAGIIQDFHSLSEHDKRGVVNGAIFLVGLFVLAAYLCLKWDK
jgi:hypothetical protein